MAARISTAKEDGGYVYTNGEIQVIFADGDHRHGEQAVCNDATVGHLHTKACAQTMLDFKPVVKEAVEADPDNGVEAQPAVLGSSMRERGMAWLASITAAPAKPTAVPMPQKTVTVKVDGKNTQKQVDNGDLT